MSCFDHRLIPKTKLFNKNFVLSSMFYQNNAKSRSDGETLSDNVRCQYDVIISWSSIELFK